MHFLPFTIFAYLLNGIAVLIDKFLLSHKIAHPLVYIFYISLLSLVILILLPFVHIPTITVFFLASLSTLLWTTGLYMLYKALTVGIVTRVIPIIGALIPIMLLIHAAFTGAITQHQTISVVLLICGIIFLTLFEFKGTIHPKELQYEILSALFFAVSYTVLRYAYLQADFLTVFAWSRVILIPVGIGLVIYPHTRSIILGSRDEPAIKIGSKQGMLFAVGQACGGLSELLLTFSVSLANPALVNSLQGSQYIFLFVASIFLAKKYPHIFREKHGKIPLLLKLLGIGFVGFGLYILEFT